MKAAHDEAGVTVLHISDTQFGQHHRFDSSDSLSAHMIRDLEKLSEGGVPPIDLVVLSGDIAEQGLRSEFDQARRFIDAICRHTGLGVDRVVVVPGNHDVNWSLSAAYFAECDADEIEPAAPYTKKWRNYQNFVTALHGPTAFTEEQPYRLHRFDDLKVVVAAMNSTMMESHRAEDHYGSCGPDQLRWFDKRLRDATGVLRIGVLHHNARRRAQADNENLRDEDDLTDILGDRLDLLLHGHTHEGKEDRLADGTLVLATGSAAVTSDWRPGEVPNQYQVLHLRPGWATRWARQWDGTGKWIADPRISRDGNTWPVGIAMSTPGWLPGRTIVETELDRGELAGWRPAGRTLRTSDFTQEVEWVTRLDVGGEAAIERRSKGNPPLDYLIAIRPAAPLRCVGIVNGRLAAATLDGFDDQVFTPLRARGPIELVVVHHGPDDPALRMAARHRGIQVKTWTEYNDLLEPSSYRAWLKSELASDRLYPQRLYQPQRFREIDRWGAAGATPREDLLSEVYDAVLDEDSRFVLILGDAGFGKSFLVRRLAYLMLDNDRVSVTPIVIYLRDRDKRQTIEEMVSSVLIASKATFRADRFQHSLEAGALALLVDGYDEFAVRVGYANAAAQLQSFIDAMRGRAKVLLTTRPSHFRSADEVTTKLFENLKTVHHGRVYLLESFETAQQRGFLARWFELRGDPDPAGTAQRWMDALEKVDNLPELAKTPRMLSFMVEDLALDELREAAREGTVTAAGLYQRLINRWLGNEETKIDPGDKRVVPAAQRQRLMEDLALELWRTGERDVTEDALHRVARAVLDLPRLEMTLDQAAQVIGGRTLLHVDGRRWRFAHQSVWEFLLAKRIAHLLRAGEGDELLGEAELTGLTIRFLRDLAPEEGAAWAARVAGNRS